MRILVRFSKWYPHPELNRDQRFRKPPLYPFELWGLQRQADHRREPRLRQYRLWGCLELGTVRPMISDFLLVLASAGQAIQFTPTRSVGPDSVFSATHTAAGNRPSSPLWTILPQWRHAEPSASLRSHPSPLFCGGNRPRRSGRRNCSSEEVT